MKTLRSHVAEVVALSLLVGIVLLGIGGAARIVGAVMLAVLVALGLKYWP